MIFFPVFFLLNSPLLPWFLYWSPNKVAITKKGTSFLVPVYIITGSLFGIRSKERFQLGTLGDYGGPVKTIPLLPGSPAIDAGASAGAPDKDARGIGRVGLYDIGAFESQGFTLGSQTGTPQSAAINTAFTAPLGLSVAPSDSSEPVAGGKVTFTAPPAGAGCTFDLNPATIGNDGLASVIATANGTIGAYSVTASVYGAVGSEFNLTNEVPVTEPLSPAVSAHSLTIIEGGTGAFSVNLGQGSSAATSAEVTSDNEQIATVDKASVSLSGEAVSISGVAAGTANITVTFNDSALTVETIAVTVKRPGGSGGGSTTSYTITSMPGEGGKISPSSAIVAKNGSKTFTITPDAGYRIVDVLVNGVSVGVVESYTFKNVTAKSAIKAVFEKIETPAAWKNPFTDVPEGAWYYHAVAFAHTRGLFAGTGETSFSPGGGMTRGMFVTVLCRLSGTDANSYINSFSDVASGSWYEKGVAWASGNGIVKGIGNNRFGPKIVITREEMAVMLYNYSRYRGIDISVSNSSEVESFSDSGETSDWARGAMAWAVNAGLLAGNMQNRLEPQGMASRAEVATILQRFVERIE